MSILHDGERALVATIRSTGEPITYIDADSVETPLQAHVGQTVHGEDTPERGNLPATVTRTTDFIVPTEDLPAAVSRSIRIRHAGRTFQPVSTNGEPISRDAGRFGLLTRIHTTLVNG